MTEARWLTKSELKTWLKLEAMAELLPGALDSPLQRTQDLTHFDYIVLAQLSEADGRSLRMSALADRTNATLPRLSHVVKRLECRGYVKRIPDPCDGRATQAVLTEDGWQKVLVAAPVHVGSVRDLVIDRLTAEQLAQLDAIASAILAGLDPTNRLRAQDSE